MNHYINFFFSYIYKPILFFLVFIGFSFYQKIFTQERDLEFYIQSAIKNNPVIAENSSLILSYNLRKEIARSSVLSPSIYTTANYLFAPSFKDMGYDSAITNGGLYSALLNFDLPLFRGTSLDVKIKSTDVEQRGYQNTIEQTRHDIEKNITDQYLKAYFDFLQIKFISDNLDLLNSEKTIVTALASRGIMKNLDLKLLEIETQTQVINLNKQEILYKADLYDLNLSAGIDDTSVVTLLKPEMATTEETHQSKFLIQYQLDSLKLDLEQKQFELNYKPQLDFFINGGLNAVTYKDIEKKIGFSTGINFTFSLYDGNQKALNGQMTIIKKDILLNNKNNFIKINQIRKANILKEIKDLIALNIAQQSQVDNYKTLLEMYSHESNITQISVIDYINIIKNYMNTRNDLLATENQKLTLINEYNYWNW